MKWFDDELKKKNLIIFALNFVLQTKPSFFHLNLFTINLQL